MPRGRWVHLTVRAETKKLLMEKCSGFSSVDECLFSLFTGELKRSSSSPVSGASFTGELRALCDEMVHGFTDLVRSYGYGFYAGLLLSLYEQGRVSTVLSRSEYLRKSISISPLSDLPRLLFDSSPAGADVYELRVKFWLRPCFDVKVRE
ncbi:MAG: hypothetical protein QXK07_07935 [Desulfurococcaceae archaeon]